MDQGDRPPVGNAHAEGQGTPARRLQVPAKETLFLEGDKALNLFQVVSGVGKIYKMMPDGRVDHRRLRLWPQPSSGSPAPATTSTTSTP